MATRKIYQSIGYIRLDLNISYKGVMKKFEFTNGQKLPIKRCGIYITDIPFEQEALETNPQFGKMYKLVSESEVFEVKKEKTDKEVINELKETNLKLMSELEKTETKPEEPKVEQIIAKDVVNAQQAKEFLLTNYPDEYDAKKLPNKTTILARAKDKNVIFPNWKI